MFTYNQSDPPSCDILRRAGNDVWGARLYTLWPLAVFDGSCERRWEKDHHGEGPRPYWMWEPLNCWLDELDAAKFCRVMEGRKGLLFAGACLILRQRLSAQTNTVSYLFSRWITTKN